ncbi:prephenate dehydratase [Clostridium thermarum]|uniref:prephenate dehydratase n=1 Tax=Clostridium thermarum TaxID=1716543 RepID=UPI0013D57510|nr:prephenate dehydratase domain-containing protein [Clostridium thermarum]
MNTNLAVKNIVIGYYGVPGSYTHDAMLSIFGDDCKEAYSESFEGVFKLLYNREVRYAVVPIENSSTGGISEVMDLLNKYNVFIVAEKCMRINQCLLGIKGTTLEDIREVYSHPQGLQQSKEFLQSHSEWKLFNYYNTAKSAQYVKQCNSKTKAAVGGIRAAKLYGLEVIKENINTNEKNFTRFIAISNELEQSDEANKISIILTLPHVVGSLYSVIKIIYESKLNMLFIESRPIPNVPWEYSFHIDVEGNLKDEKVRNGLERIKTICRDFKVLGNFVKDC